MMTAKQRRALGILIALALLGAAAALVLSALKENVVYFHAPADIKARRMDVSRPFRLGGLVEKGSLQQIGQDHVRFDVTDFTATVRVEYRGALPDLFREGQGVIAEGRLRDDGVFNAEQVLAKHDENYMPPEVAERLKPLHRKNGKTQPLQAPKENP